MVTLHEIYKNSKFLWEKLIEFDCAISMLVIELYPQMIQINIYFKYKEELEKFFNITNDELKKITNYYFEYCLNNLTLCLKPKLNNVINLFENLIFPSKTNSMKIIINSLNNNLKIMSKPIKLFNLPSQLEKLEIITSSISFDLSNLPTNLTSLCIKNSKCKFNFDYLPHSIKILHIPFYYNMFFSKLECFNLNDIYNLPESIEQIWISETKYYTKKEFINLMIDMLKN